MAQGGAPRPTNPTHHINGAAGRLVAQAPAQTKAPPEGRGSRHQTGLPEGGCGNGSRPATTTPSRRVAQIAAPEGSTSPGAFCMEGVGLPARAPGSGSSDRAAVCPNRNNPRVGGFHERYPNMETSMSIRTIFALTLFAAVAISSAALAQGGGGGGGGAGGGGAGGASSGAAGGASGAGGAAGTTGGATKGAPNAGTTTGSGVNSNATGQRPGGNTTNSRDNINNQDRNPRR